MKIRITRFAKKLSDLSQTMGIFAKGYRCNSIFISQHMDADEDQASLIITLADRDKEADKEEDYLKLRRLFRAFEYRFNKDIKDFEVEIKLKRKDGK